MSQAPPAGDRLSRFSHAAALYELTKPGIAGYVMVTAGVAYLVAAEGVADFLPVVWTLVGTVLATGGALALNQFVEWELDALMERTRSRPLPAGRLSARGALVWGLASSAVGTILLFVIAGWLPADAPGSSADDPRPGGAA